MTANSSILSNADTTFLLLKTLPTVRQTLQLANTCRLIRQTFLQCCFPPAAGLDNMHHPLLDAQGRPNKDRVLAFITRTNPFIVAQLLLQHPVLFQHRDFTDLPVWKQVLAAICARCILLETVPDLASRATLPCPDLPWPAIWKGLEPIVGYALIQPIRLYLRESIENPELRSYKTVYQESSLVEAAIRRDSYTPDADLMEGIYAYIRLPKSDGYYQLDHVVSTISDSFLWDCDNKWWPEYREHARVRLAHRPAPIVTPNGHTIQPRPAYSLTYKKYIQGPFHNLNNQQFLTPVNSTTPRSIHPDVRLNRPNILRLFQTLRSSGQLTDDPEHNDKHSTLKTIYAEILTYAIHSIDLTIVHLLHQTPLLRKPTIPPGLPTGSALSPLLDSNTWTSDEKASWAIILLDHNMLLKDIAEWGEYDTDNTIWTCNYTPSDLLSIHTLLKPHNRTFLASSPDIHAICRLGPASHAIYTTVTRYLRLAYPLWTLKDFLTILDPNTWTRGLLHVGVDWPKKYPLEYLQAVLQLDCWSDIPAEGWREVLALFKDEGPWTWDMDAKAVVECAMELVGEGRSLSGVNLVQLSQSVKVGGDDDFMLEDGAGEGDFEDDFDVGMEEEDDGDEESDEYASDGSH
ncbi:hypothetical protein HDV00_006618 [Rhizophlyctis rosea]|nr:hypothetical protein HDV00_006618 [Rhizophlyctis rosea]